MSNLKVPSVTMEDLQAFQAKHFPVHEQPSTDDYPAEEIEEDYVDYDDDDDDDLGYYPDGVKRTLTDEQIRIFRHSEIHALQREKQAEEEALAERISEQKSENADTQAKEPEPEPEPEQESRNGNSSRQSDLKEIQPEQARGNGSETISLDYGEGQEKAPQSFSHPPFAGRRIISYDD